MTGVNTEIYNDFFNASDKHELGGLYNTTSSFGYFEAYQTGALALINAYYYKKDSTRKNNCIGQRTLNKEVTS